MPIFLNRFVIVAASSMVVAASLAVPTAQAATCQAWNATSGDASSADLQIVIDVANPGDTIRVAGRCTGTFIIDKDLIVQRARGADHAILDGARAGTVLTITGTQANHLRVRLGHLTITGGTAELGGGIHSDFGRVDLSSSAVTDNRATRGGGIYSVGSLVLSRTRVSGNRADRLGGGIFSDGLLRLTAGGMSSIRNNRAVNGGGVYSIGEGVVLRGRSQIARNISGGIYSSWRHRTACDVTMYGSSSVQGNRQGPKRASDGGGIVGCNRIVMNDRSTVHHNQGFYGLAANSVVLYDRARVSDNVGTGIDADRVTMRHQSRVVRNEASSGYSGGGISVESGRLRMSGHSTVARNAARAGGGVYATFSTVILRDRAAITHNEATRTGGGVYSYQICTSRHYQVLTYGRSTISGNVPNDIFTLWDPDGCD